MKDGRVLLRVLMLGVVFILIGSVLPSQVSAGTFTKGLLENNESDQSWTTTLITEGTAPKIIYNGTEYIIAYISDGNVYIKCRDFSGKIPLSDKEYKFVTVAGNSDNVMVVAAGYKRNGTVIVQVTGPNGEVANKTFLKMDCYLDYALIERGDVVKIGRIKRTATYPDGVTPLIAEPSLIYAAGKYRLAFSIGYSQIIALWIQEPIWSTLDWVSINYAEFNEDGWRVEEISNVSGIFWPHPVAVVNGKVRVYWVDYSVESTNDLLYIRNNIVESIRESEGAWRSSTIYYENGIIKTLKALANKHNVYLIWSSDILSYYPVTKPSDPSQIMEILKKHFYELYKRSDYRLYLGYYNGNEWTGYVYITDDYQVDGFFDASLYNGVLRVVYASRCPCNPTINYIEGTSFGKIYTKESIASGRYPSILTTPSGKPIIIYERDNNIYLATPPQNYEINEAKNYILSLSKENFKKGRDRIFKRILTRRYRIVEFLIEKGRYRAARKLLQYGIMRHMDGYFGGFDKDDWIVTYDAQKNLRTLNLAIYARTGVLTIEYLGYNVNYGGRTFTIRWKVYWTTDKGGITWVTIETPNGNTITKYGVSENNIYSVSVDFAEFGTYHITIYAKEFIIDQGWIQTQDGPYDIVIDVVLKEINVATKLTTVYVSWKVITQPVSTGVYYRASGSQTWLYAEGSYAYTSMDGYLVYQTTLTNLAPGTTYEIYAVAVIDSTQYSSDTTSFSTIELQIYDLSITEVGPDHLKVFWRTNFRGNSRAIARNLLNPSDTHVAYSNDNSYTHELTISGLQPYTGYYIRVISSIDSYSAYDHITAMTKPYLSIDIVISVHAVPHTEHLDWITKRPYHTMEYLVTVKYAPNYENVVPSVTLTYDGNTLTEFDENLPSSGVSVIHLASTKAYTHLHQYDGQQDNMYFYPRVDETQFYDIHYYITYYNEVAESTKSFSPLCTDTDGDGLYDAEEISWYLSLPDNTQSDRDGIEDGKEVIASMGGLYGVYYIDSSGNIRMMYAWSEPAYTDSDDDGLTDNIERGDNEMNIVLSAVSSDSDTDGLYDGYEYYWYRYAGEGAWQNPLEYNNIYLVAFWGWASALADRFIFDRELEYAQKWLSENGYMCGYSSYPMVDFIYRKSYATKEWVMNALDELSSRITERDILIIFISDHGGYGTFDSETNAYLPMDGYRPEDPLEEQLDKIILPEEMAEKINNINSKLTVLIDTTCSSGSFIYAVGRYLGDMNSDVKLYALAAATGDSHAWFNDGIGADVDGDGVLDITEQQNFLGEFFFYLYSGLCLKTPLSQDISQFRSYIDKDPTDGYVTVWEAYNFATKCISTEQHPTYLLFNIDNGKVIMI